MHPMLRLLLHNAGTRRLAAQALKSLARTPRDPTARDQRELARRLRIARGPDETPARALQRHLEERHDAHVTVKLDRRGVTLTPRGSQRPAHRLIYPFHPDHLVRDAQHLSRQEPPP